LAVCIWLSYFCSLLSFFGPYPVSLCLQTNSLCYSFNGIQEGKKLDVFIQPVNVNNSPTYIFTIVPAMNAVIMYARNYTSF
jgi:hypothetical protein